MTVTRSRAAIAARDTTLKILHTVGYALWCWTDDKMSDHIDRKA